VFYELFFLLISEGTFVGLMLKLIGKIANLTYGLWVGVVKLAI
jgi:hypothetical protein